MTYLTRRIPPPPLQDGKGRRMAAGLCFMNILPMLLGAMILAGAWNEGGGENFPLCLATYLGGFAVYTGYVRRALNMHRHPTRMWMLSIAYNLTLMVVYSGCCINMVSTSAWSDGVFSARVLNQLVVCGALLTPFMMYPLSVIVCSIDGLRHDRAAMERERILWDETYYWQGRAGEVER